MDLLSLICSEKVEDNYPFYAVYLGYALETFRILFGKVIPEEGQINFHAGKTGGGSILGFPKIAA